MVRYSLICALAALLLSACTPKVQFSGPMPPSRPDLPNIPKAYRGVIQDEIGPVVVGKDSVWMGEEVFVNGRDFVLRKMAGYVVMSQPVPETGHWEVRLLEREGDLFRLGSFEDQDALVRQMTLLTSTAPERKKSNSFPHYQYWLFDPSPKEFRAILKQRAFQSADTWTALPKGGVVTRP